MMHRAWTLAAVLGAALSMVGGAALAQDARPYKIGSIFSLTGSGALLGERMKTTVEMMVEDSSKQGGTNG